MTLEAPLSVVWELPVPSTSFARPDVELVQRPRRELALGYGYEAPTGEIVQSMLVFEETNAFRCTYRYACDAWMLGAYDKLVEVVGSEWAANVNQRMRTMFLARGRNASPTLRHYAIFFDDGPCYEVMATSFRVESSELPQSE